MPVVVRSQEPPKVSNYKKYKHLLRADFRCRCAYCRIHESNFGTYWNFTVDHFRPRAKFPKLSCDYGNLYYACNPCNCFKRDRWPNARERRAGSRFFDACAEEFDDHFETLPGGMLSPKTGAGAYTIESIRLNRRSLLRRRVLDSELAAWIRELQAEIAALEAERVLPDLEARRARFVEGYRSRLRLLERVVSPPCET